MDDPARAFIRGLALYFYPPAGDPQERRMLRFAAVLELRAIGRRSADPLQWKSTRASVLSGSPPKGGAKMSYGTVTDYATGEPVRPATAEELARTEAKLASGDSDAYTGAWTDKDGRTVYVDA